MPTNEGFVAILKRNGMAQVVIQPVSAGIPGASNRVNRHVCHCATDGSTLTIDALNGVGAEVGDHVSVRRDSSGLTKNAAALLGIPLLGIIAGILLAVLCTDGFSSGMVGGMIALTACVIVGTTIGLLTFRRVSAVNLAVIEKVIEKSSKGGRFSSGNPFCSVDANRGCSSCGR